MVLYRKFNHFNLLVLADSWATLFWALFRSRSWPNPIVSPLGLGLNQTDDLSLYVSSVQTNEEDDDLCHFLPSLNCSNNCIDCLGYNLILKHLLPLIHIMFLLSHPLFTLLSSSVSSLHLRLHLHSTPTSNSFLAPPSSPACSRFKAFISQKELSSSSSEF